LYHRIAVDIYTIFREVARNYEIAAKEQRFILPMDHPP